MNLILKDIDYCLYLKGRKKGLIYHDFKVRTYSARRSSDKLLNNLECRRKEDLDRRVDSFYWQNNVNKPGTSTSRYVIHSVKRIFSQNRQRRAFAASYY